MLSAMFSGSFSGQVLYLVRGGPHRRLKPSSLSLPTVRPLREASGRGCIPRQRRRAVRAHPQLPEVRSRRSARDARCRVWATFICVRIGSAARSRSRPRRVIAQSGAAPCTSRARETHVRNPSAGP